MGEGKVEHNLALNVTRLTRPTFAGASTIRSMMAPMDLDLRDGVSSGDSGELSPLAPSSILAAHRHSLNLSKALLLPQTFGSIYLGETLTCYISLHNDSTDTCTGVSLNCGLQTATQRLSLLHIPSSSSGTHQQTIPPTGAASGAELVPGSSLDHILSYEVKEPCTHILVFEVFYGAPHRSKQTFRKLLKFQVMEPFDVKTKFFNAEPHDVILEAQIQNLTDGPLFLEKMDFEPSPVFQATELNHLSSAAPINHKNDKDEAVEKGRGRRSRLGGDQLVFGRINCLQPQECRQYLFSLTPRNDVKMSFKQFKGVTNIGVLDIVWKTNMGDKGRLQTSQLQRQPPNFGDIHLFVQSVPSVAQLNKAFEICCFICNYSDRTMELELSLEDAEEKSRMLWSGSCHRKLGLVEPSGTVEIALEAVPLDTSLQSLSGVRLTDNLLKRTYRFDDFCHIFVVRDSQMISSADASRSFVSIC